MATADKQGLKQKPKKTEIIHRNNTPKCDAPNCKKDATVRYRRNYFCDEHSIEIPKSLQSYPLFERLAVLDGEQ